jgi:AraC-like DNA-binding protein
MVYALKCYAEGFEHHGNVLALYRNTKLFRAVRAIHSYPERSWTLASLARESAMSRTRFAELFSKEAGITATQYLTWWRMQLAWAKLSSGESVESVSESVGYRSEAAFARAFKKVFGKTVGVVRARGRIDKKSHRV